MGGLYPYFLLMHLMQLEEVKLYFVRDCCLLDVAYVTGNIVLLLAIALQTSHLLPFTLMEELQAREAMLWDPNPLYCCGYLHSLISVMLGLVEQFRNQNILEFFFLCGRYDQACICFRSVMLQFTVVVLQFFFVLWVSWFKFNSI